MTTYHTLITNNGKAQIANAINTNTKVAITHLAVGDGRGTTPTPSAGATRLTGEKARVAVNHVGRHATKANWIEVHAIIPSSTGGFTVREIGLYAGKTLIAVGSFPATYKPSATEGSAREISIKLIIAVENASVVNVTLDDSLVYATRKWTQDNFVNHNEVIDNLTSTETTKPLSAAQGKKLQDDKLGKTENAVSATKLATARTINGVAFDGTQNITINDNTKAPAVHRHNWSEIDGKPAIITHPTQITSGDLDDYKEIGVYYCHTNVHARDIANTPSNLAFALEVVRAAGVVQIFREYETAIVYMRAFYRKWSPWKRLATTEDNAPTATKLATARTLALTGAVTGSVNFDGSGNVSLATALKGIDRREYTGTLTPSHNSFKSQKVPMTGSVEVLPDGRMVQYFNFECPIIYFHRHNQRSFYREKLNGDYFNANEDKPLLELPLWTPMPSKVQEARIHLSTGGNHYSYGEAMEWIYDWDSIFNQKANIKDKAYFAFRRHYGNNDEAVTFTIVVEGY
ncbi:phage tail-collar fiber domain-containing protein [Moraxella bovoculi]|uniref:phage tail-collar fiber domain-containing protein n=1 Tax=Moraxella bovoculi TaxID=386891 RepID=UPI0009BC4DDE|nr:phage tail protein [Moraxella bovoculi]